MVIIRNPRASWGTPPHPEICANVPGALSGAWLTTTLAPSYIHTGCPCSAGIDYTVKPSPFSNSHTHTHTHTHTHGHSPWVSMIFCNSMEHLGDHEVGHIMKHTKHHPSHRFTPPPPFFFSLSLSFSKVTRNFSLLEQNSPAHSGSRSSPSPTPKQIYQEFLLNTPGPSVNGIEVNMQSTHVKQGTSLSWLGAGPSLLLVQGPDAHNPPLAQESPLFSLTVFTWV